MTTNYNEILKEADKLYSKGEYVAALNKVDEIKEKDKKVSDFKFNMLLNISKVCEQSNDIQSLMFCFLEMEKIYPKNENVLLKIALLLENINDLPNALLYYEKILSINKRNYDALIHIAILFAGVKKFKNALNYIEKAKRVKPNQFKTAYAYFKVYEGDFKFKDAIRYAKEMVLLNPKDADGYYYCARTYYHLFDYNKAIEYCDKYLNFEPDDINILCLKLECLKKSGIVENVIPIYEKLIEKYPASYTIKRLHSSQALQNKDYETGMKYYLDVVSPLKIEQDRGKVGKKFLEYEKKHWKRENISDKTVLVHQGTFGAGDFLMFSRYIPYVENKAGKVLIEANENFYELFKNNFKNSEVIKETKEGIPPEYYDYSVSCMELFYNVNPGFNEFPFAKGWLNIAKEKIQHAEKSGVFSKKKINTGLFWRGSGGPMKYRNVDLPKLIPLLDLQNYNFISFDIAKKDEETMDILNKYNISDISSHIKNAEDTAAFMKNLDLLISVDSFPLHLAGALGVKTFAILPVLSEWRWFDDTETTPWYNSVKIFRQTETLNIDNVIENVKTALMHFD